MEYQEKNKLMKIKWGWLFALLIIMLYACNNKDQTHEEVKSDYFLQEYWQSEYKIEFTEMNWSNCADTISFKFKIVDQKNNEKRFWNEIRPQETKIINDRISIADINILERDQKNIPEDILVSLLIDRSIGSDDMKIVQKAVQHFVDSLPHHTVYISFFDNEIENTQSITSANFYTFNHAFEATNNSKIIFDAALEKFKELSGDFNPLFNSEITMKSHNDTIKKYLIILTDGKINANDPRTSTSLNDFFEYINELDNNEDNKNRIEIHAIRYGEENKEVDNNLSFLCKDIRKNVVKGEFYPAAQNTIFEKLKEFSDKISPDYEIILTNSSGRIYSGEPQDFMMQIEKNEKKAWGIKQKYVIGTLANPIVTGSCNTSIKLLLGLLWGILAFFIAYFFMQVIVPYLIFKTSNFNKKYVKLHKPDEDELVKCSICLEDLIEGEEVVVKCQHIAHKYCWRENGYKCTEYGQNCKNGKQYYFDKDKPFSAVNRPYFMKWVLYGLIGGLLSWAVYQLIISYNPLIFGKFTQILLNRFYPGDLKDLEIFDYQMSFLTKTGALLLLGLLLGFILSVMFSYINEYRKKNLKVWSIIVLRGCLGALVGFVSFLIGAIIIIACKANETNIWIDWIPWLIFGGGLGLCLSIKTSIVWGHALLGGIISGLFSFFILFLSKLFGSYAVLFSFMLYSAGLGFSIVTIHYTAQKYFLKYKGRREGEIAIHKWMSVSGGSNDVTIGKSNHCIIQMNWDDSENIQDIHAKLYIDKKMKVPFLKIMEENMSYNGNMARKNSEFQLKNGITFKIGNTEFQYIEKI